MNEHYTKSMVPRVGWLLICAAVLLLADVARAADAKKDVEHRILVPRTAYDHKNGCPDIVRLKDGRLFLAFREGYHHVNVPTPMRDHVERFMYEYFRMAPLKDLQRPTGSRILGMWSSDEGKTWTEPVQLVDNPAADGDCMLSVLRDGTVTMVIFTFTVHENLASQDPLPVLVTPRWRSGNIMEVVVHTSKDGGKTWSDARKVENFFQPWQCSPSPIIETDSGKWLLGFCGKTFSGSCGGIAESTDQGRSWKLCLIADGPYGHTETGMARLADGRVLACWRPAAHRIFASSDEGQRWQLVAEAPEIGKIEWPALYQMSDGKVVLFIGGGKPRLMWTSDLKTWHGPFLIGDAGNAKVRGVELKDGALLCAWHDELSKEGQEVCIAKVKLSEKGLQVSPP